MTTLEPGSIGYAVGWLIGGSLAGIGNRDIPIFPDGEPGVRLVIPLDGALREYGIYQRRACAGHNGRWYYDFVATTTDPDVTPATTNAESGPTSVLPAASQIHPSVAASSIIWPEANPATMARPAESAPWNGEVPARRFLRWVSRFADQETPLATRNSHSCGSPSKAGRANSDRPWRPMFQLDRNHSRLLRRRVEAVCSLRRPFSEDLRAADGAAVECGGWAVHDQ